MHQLKYFAIDIAGRRASVDEKIRSILEIHYKGDINLVTEADKMSENIIIEAIRRNFPDHGSCRKSLRRFSTDRPALDNRSLTAPPITLMAILFSVFHRLEKGGVDNIGGIYDPTRKDTFVAVRGRGAYLNGKILAVSKTPDLNRSLLATGSLMTSESKENNLNYFAVMAKEVQLSGGRSRTLDIAYVACGRFDGFWN